MKWEINYYNNIRVYKRDMSPTKKKARRVVIIYNNILSVYSVLYCYVVSVISKNWWFHPHDRFDPDLLLHLSVWIRPRHHQSFRYRIIDHDSTTTKKKKGMIQSWWWKKSTTTTTRTTKTKKRTNNYILLILPGHPSESDMPIPIDRYNFVHSLDHRSFPNKSWYWYW